MNDKTKIYLGVVAAALVGWYFWQKSKEQQAQPSGGTQFPKPPNVQPKTTLLPGMTPGAGTQFFAPQYTSALGNLSPEQQQAFVQGLQGLKL